jgi:hypothetical protein
MCRYSANYFTVAHKSCGIFFEFHFCAELVPVGILYQGYVGTNCGLAIVSRTIDQLVRPQYMTLHHYPTITHPKDPLNKPSSG